MNWPVRPLAWLGFLTLGGLTAACAMGQKGALLGAAVLAALGGALLVAAFLVKNLKRIFSPIAVFCLLVSLSLGLYGLAYEGKIAPYLPLNGEEAVMSGTVLTTPVEKESGGVCTVRVEKLSESKLQLKEGQTFRVLFNTALPLATKAGQQIQGRVRFRTFEGEGLYSLASSYFADGIVLRAMPVQVDSVRLLPGTVWGAEIAAAHMRDFVGQRLGASLSPEGSGLVQAMLLGQRENLSGELRANFRRVGVSHLLAISGLHLSVLAGMVSLLLRKLRVSRRVSACLCFGVVLLFLFLIGFPPAAFRSGLMVFTMLAGQCFFRKADSLNSLGLSAFLLSVMNPLSAGDVGLHLSVCATAGILLFSRFFSDSLRLLFERVVRGKLCLPRGFWDSLGVSLSAMAATLPIQFVVFGGVSLLTPLSNLLLVFPAMVFLWICTPFALLVVAVPLEFLWQAPAFLVNALAQLIAQIAAGLSAMPSFFWSGRGVMGICTLSFALLWVLFLRKEAFRKNLRFTAAALLSFALLALLGAGGLNTFSRAPVLVVRETGGEPCILLQMEGKAAVLCCGEAEELEVLLSERNVQEISVVRVGEERGLAVEEAARLARRYENAYFSVRENFTPGPRLESVFQEERLLRGTGFASFEGIWVTYLEDGGLCLSAPSWEMTVYRREGEKWGTALWEFLPGKGANLPFTDEGRDGIINLREEGVSVPCGYGEDFSIALEKGGVRFLPGR